MVREYREAMLMPYRKDIPVEELAIEGSIGIQTLLVD